MRGHLDQPPPSSSHWPPAPPTIPTVDSQLRIDGVEKVTGATVYAADITLPGMLWAKVVRSPVPHARIVSIDASRARVLPGVHTVLTGMDIPDVRVGRSMRDMPVLARDKVRFVGEKVAAVAADSQDIAEEAIGLIEVVYDELPAVFDPIEAMQPGAPLVHDPALVRAWATPKQRVADYPNSVSNPIWGASEQEMEQAFARCAHVFEHTFRTPIQHQGYLEPHACLVAPGSGGPSDSQGSPPAVGETTAAREDVHSLAAAPSGIWASNKAPFLLLDYLRLGLGLQREDVEIHMLPLGGDFGGKGSFMDIPLVYFLAEASGRPVKMIMTYTEELMAGNPRHSAVVRVRSGFDERGKLLARWTKAVYNSGGYAAFKPALDATLPGIRGGSLGAYEIPISRVEGHMVYTNTVPCGHMRAPGEAQTIHAVECHMDLCAREMGIDPLELRLLNAPDTPRQTETGAPGSLPRAREALRAAADAIDWGQPKPEGVGRGIALVEVGNSVGEYSAAMIVQHDGQIVLQTPIIENGAGALTAFRLIVADAFGVKPDQVRVEQTLEGIAYDRGVGGSRITRMIGRMINVLSQRLQQRLGDLVAAEFDHDSAQMTFEAGGLRGPDGRFHTIAEAASLSPADLHELLRYEPGPFDVVEVFVGLAAEVKVDRDTGRVEILRVANAHEVGRVIHPVMHQGQIDGGLVQGLGYAMSEGLEFDGGRVTNAALNEYKLPVASDIPPLTTILLEPDLSLGITPIGEGPNCAMSACIVNAVVDALGQQVQIPIRPEALLAQESSV